MEILQPEHPAGFYPLKLIGKQFGFEVASLKSICKKLSIDVVSIDRNSYISEEARPILEKAVLAKKSGIQVDLTSTTTTKLIPTKKIKSDAPEAPAPSQLVVRADGAAATPQEFLQVLLEVMKQQQATSAPPAPTPISPIQQQRELKDAADNGFLLSSEQLSNIFGLKKSSISSWKDGHKRLGFRFIKTKENNISLWKVEQY